MTEEDIFVIQRLDNKWEDVAEFHDMELAMQARTAYVKRASGRKLRLVKRKSEVVVADLTKHK